MKRVWIAVAGLSVFATLALIYLAPPLFQSSSYKVHYAVNGVAHSDGVLFKPILTSGLYYVHLPALKGKLYSWFGVDFHRGAVFVPAAIYDCPVGFTYIHRDQAKGANLFDHKAGDWRVEFRDQKVVFSSDGVEVGIEK